VILVTGGTSGIGEAIVEALRCEGESVMTVSRQTMDSEDHFSCDVSDFNSVKTVAKKLKQRQINLKAVVNCAGIASMNLALTTPASIVERVIQTNLIGTIYVNQAFAPLLIRAGEGRIINFSTIAVSLALQGESIYVASKAGVEAFTRTFARELSSFNITVNCIAPGPIRTNLLKGISNHQIAEIVDRQIIRKEMSTLDICNTVKMLLSQESSAITGQVFHIGGV
jgi:3-oxoacyl-[acyl-carrier protein] reductase